MFSTLLINATDLAAWSSRLDARSQLPCVLRRLIQATASDLELLQFPSDEGIQTGGWDGFAVSRGGNTFVPAGPSVWEMGVNSDIKGKADDDYTKRTQNPLGLDPASTTFVFVTPRNWANKDAWVSARKSENKWRDVRVYDAGDLSTWLENAPAVHLWLSTLTGKHPQGAQTLEEFWDDWSSQTDPVFSHSLVLSGRNAARERVEKWLRGKPTPLALKGESPEEALAFLAGAVASCDAALREQYLSRAIVVESAAAWQELILSSSPTILIPHFGDEIQSVSRAVKNGHHVFLAGTHAGARSDDALPRPVRDAAENALQEMGVPSARASELATLARRSFPALRRKVASVPTLHKPAWAQTERARELLAPILIGTWQDGNPADREILTRLAGVAYQQLQETLVGWSKSVDPPVRLVGGIWMIAAPEDAWRLLAPFLTNDDITRFRKIGIEVLSLHLPRPSSTLIEIHGAVSGNEVPQCSDILREGIATTLALMTALSSEVSFVADISGEDIARGVVWSLFDKAKADLGLWTSFAPVLPLLAEAAPTQFLDAVDAGLQGESPLLSRMFEKHDPMGFGPFSPHTYLLWALETLVWNADYLGRAVLQLARLVRLDPGDRHGNHPSDSLRQIFVLWYPNTTATLERRLKVLDVMRKREPQVAWSLMLRILPTSHGDTCMHPHAPKWHDWKPDTPRPIFQSEIFEAVTGIVDRLLSDAGADVSRWCALVSRTGDLWPLEREKLLAQLNSLDAEILSSEERLTLGNAIRSLVARHSDYPEASWAMPTDSLIQLELSARSWPHKIQFYALAGCSRGSFPCRNGGLWTGKNETWQSVSCGKTPYRKSFPCRDLMVSYDWHWKPKNQILLVLFWAGCPRLL